LHEEHPDWYVRGFAEKLQVCPRAYTKLLGNLALPVKRFTYSEKLEKEGEAFLKGIAEIPEKRRV
jgi:hypothetical protein